MEKDIRIRVLEDTVGSLESKITNLEEKIENSYKEKNIIIDGMKEEKNENVRTLATNFIQSKLEINLKDYEVNEAFRVGRYRSSTPRRIVTKFSNTNIKNEVYQKRLKLRQDPSAKNIYINEDLTKNKQEILYETRKLKRKKNISNTWTRDGRVFIKVAGQDNPKEMRKGRVEQIQRST